EYAAGGGAGPAADVFALGVVLYEMAAGRRPFTGSTAAGVIASILTDEPVPLARHNPDVPRVLEDVVQQMLRKEPTRRPTALDVVRELTAWQPSMDAPAPRAASPRITVGRESEHARLLRAYTRVRDGRSRIVALTG